MLPPEASTGASAAAVVVVDPCSTGSALAVAASKRGLQVVALWSSESVGELRTHVSKEFSDLGLLELEEQPGGLEATSEVLLAAVRAAGWHLQAVIVGGDTGVPLADRLSLALGLRTNGTLAAGCRRNKHVQRECLRAAGLRAVREVLGTDWAEVESFVEAEGFPLVLKPVSSACSDGVKLCHSKEEAEAHFRQLMSSQQKVGSAADAGVLVQEFLRGKEFVVDHVSRDGKHKTVNLAVYDKRACNGKEFVYHGLVPLPNCGSQEAKQLIEYTRRVLDSLNIMNGPTHGEVIMTSNGPCLVEMNCRAIGGDGMAVNFLSSIHGYSQLDVTLDAFLDESSFVRRPETTPDCPRAAGYLALLVSHRAGVVAGHPGMETIRSLSSFNGSYAVPAIGRRVQLTTDLFSNVGYIELMNDDATALARDIDTIRAIEGTCALFDFKEDATLTSRTASESLSETTLSARAVVVGEDHDASAEVPTQQACDKYFRDGNEAHGEHCPYISLALAQSGC